MVKFFINDIYLDSYLLSQVFDVLDVGEVFPDLLWHVNLFAINIEFSGGGGGVFRKYAPCKIFLIPCCFQRKKMAPLFPPSRRTPTKMFSRFFFFFGGA